MSAFLCYNICCQMVNIMNKDEIYNFIKGKGIWYEVTEHKAVYSMDDLKDVELPYREGNARIYLCVMIRRKIII